MFFKFFQTISLSCIFIFSGCNKSTETSTSKKETKKETEKETEKSVKTPVKPAPPKKIKKVVPPPIKWSKLIKMTDKQDIAVLPDKKGLLLVDTTGKIISNLVPKNILWGAYDNKAQGIWYITGSKKAKKSNLYFYDLVKSSSHLILKNTPGDKDLGDYPLSVVYNKARLSGLPEQFEASIVINMKKLTFSLDFNYRIQEDHDKNRIKKKLADLKLQNKDFLKTLKKRGKTRQLYPSKPKGKFKKLKIISKEGCLRGSKELCGDAVFIPGTSIYTVLIEHSCEDFCHSKTIFYDADKKIFMDPENFKKTYKSDDQDESWLQAKGNFSSGIFSPLGKGMIFGRELKTWKQGKVFSFSGRGGSWIKGGYHIN